MSRVTDWGVVGGVEGYRGGKLEVEACWVISSPFFIPFIHPSLYCTHLHSIAFLFFSDLVIHICIIVVYAFVYVTRGWDLCVEGAWNCFLFLRFG